MTILTDTERHSAITALINSTYPDRLVDDKQHELWHYATAMMAAYMAKYPRSTEKFRVIAVEHGAVGPIINPKTTAAAKAVAYALKADGLLQMLFDESHYLMEHKTAGRMDNAYLDKLWSDFQIISYSLYLEEQEDIKISGVVYNVLVKPGLKQSKGESEEEYQARYEELCKKNKSGKSNATRKEPETDTEFQARLAKWYAEDDERLHREEILIDKQQYDEVRTELWQMAQLYLHLRREKSWPRNRKACFNWGRKCGYYEPCSAKPHEEEAMIELFLKHEPPHRELAEMLGIKREIVENSVPSDETPSDSTSIPINEDAAYVNEQVRTGQVDLWSDF